MSDDRYQLPMFPLGRVALPGETVPLRVFEPRYLTMMSDVAAGAGEFGVALIARGWEVGGGDERFAVATACRVIRDVAFGEEQRAVVAVAGRRIHVRQWLDDDPYPRALVADDPVEDDAVDLADLHQRVRRLYALASELGADISGVELDEVDAGPGGLWRLASLVPLGEFDRQRILEASTARDRLELLGAMADDALADLRLRLAEG